jgi:hypothetical protein
MAIAAIVALCVWGAVLAQPVDDDATCDISVTVADIMEWSSNFPPIVLDDITSQATVVTDDSTLMLYTNGDVEITADISSGLAQLTGPDNDKLVTEYALSYDGNGSTTGTGGAAVGFTNYDAFLSSGSDVTHVSGDGAVDVTLSVRASNASGELANAGLYNATQTLTAAWAL